MLHIFESLSGFHFRNGPCYTNAHLQHDPETQLWLQFHGYLNGTRALKDLRLAFNAARERGLENTTVFEKLQSFLNNFKGTSNGSKKFQILNFGGHKVIFGHGVNKISTRTSTSYPNPHLNCYRALSSHTKKRCFKACTRFTPPADRYSPWSST